MAISCLHVVISGRVQGVGFRYATLRQANALGLTGWVRNLPDGCVEVECEGPRSALEQMLEFCERGPSFSSVFRTEAIWSQGEPRYGHFTIR